jgi:hypothetical protein
LCKAKRAIPLLVWWTFSWYLTGLLSGPYFFFSSLSV